MKGTNWICTLNNPEKTLEMLWNPEKMLYMVGQLEEGQEGTPHLQFFARFKNPVRITYWKATDKKIHAELTKNAIASIKYCQKEESRKEGPWEYGENKNSG